MPRIFRHWMLWPALAMLLVFFLMPSVDILRASVMDPELTFRHFERFLERAVYMRVLWHTVEVSFVVAIVCAVIAYPVAYFIVQSPRRVQFLLLLLIFIPLWMSILIRSYAWMVVLGREGVINSLLMGAGLIETPVRMLFTTPAVYVAMIQILLPIQIVTCYSAMSDIDLGLVRAARVLGASPWEATRRVFIPLSLDGTITGMIIVFMLSMGFFITPALLGGRRDLLLANLIEFNVTQLNWGFAAAIALMLLLAAIVGIVVIRLAARLLLRALNGALAR
ncbi:ABC transporter permease [Aestuariivita sp.]|jgi:putative spermidine/putrescine transport system permease protein|uniref:ABC transporter permease n=1 Tax=Aestuariivita sp. TaxID=1872407 RepID=UPI00217166A6|nr:ABC transporter permease [Aestuariivita sp.]MCE8009563.1 ABC transporter permease [Aestuariivita sp.]